LAEESDESEESDDDDDEDSENAEGASCMTDLLVDINELIASLVAWCGADQISKVRDLIQRVLSKVGSGSSQSSFLEQSPATRMLRVLKHKLARKTRA